MRFPAKNLELYLLIELFENGMDVVRRTGVRSSDYQIFLGCIDIKFLTHDAPLRESSAMKRISGHIVLYVLLVYCTKRK